MIRELHREVVEGEGSDSGERGQKVVFRELPYVGSPSRTKFSVAV